MPSKSLYIYKLVVIVQSLCNTNENTKKLKRTCFGNSKHVKCACAKQFKQTKHLSAAAPKTTYNAYGEWVVDTSLGSGH